MKRREFLIGSAAIVLAGCKKGGGGNTKVRSWGAQGIRDGEFLYPRAIGCNGEKIYVIDKSGRIQVFTNFGTFAQKWSIPDKENGTPTSVSFDSDGNILVPDTHYSRILTYDKNGILVSQFGKFGLANNEFIYPTDIARLPSGEYAIVEYGTGAERLRIFDSSMKFVRGWGTLGSDPGMFNRAMGIAIAKDGTIFVADTANHRIQCFDSNGKFISSFGGEGTERGKLKFPEDVSFAPDGTLVVCEYGNNRISRFDHEGKFIGMFGEPGRAIGQFGSPRGVSVSNDGIVYVADTENHRVQYFPLETLT